MLEKNSNLITFPNKNLYYACFSNGKALYVSITQMARWQYLSRLKNYIHIMVTLLNHRDSSKHIKRVCAKYSTGMTLGCG
jgi:hypothetical protein